MSRRQVRVEYSGATELDIDEPLIVDGLGANPTDDEIEDAIRADIAGYMDNGSDVMPVEHTYRYDRDALIASVRDEIARRKAVIATVDGIRVEVVADVGAAVDTTAILAAMGVDPDRGNTRVHVLPCDGGYVVNVMAAGVVLEERARRMVARRAVVVEAAPQGVVEAIAEACNDGSAIGWSTKEGA